MTTGTTRRALTGGALLAVVGTTVGSAAAPQPEGGADAGLIATCWQHSINTRAVDAADDLDDDDPLWVAYDATRDAISAAKPKTLAGMAAKAQAAIKFATDPSGKINPSDPVVENWAWDLVNDLVRLGGRA